MTKNHADVPWRLMVAMLSVALCGCSVVVSGEPECGNGVKEFNEECDGQDVGGETCETLVGRGSGGVLSCNGSCQIEIGGCSSPWTCGDDVCQVSESLLTCFDCFDTDCGDGICQAYEHVGFCPADCDAEATCGNGLRDLGEDCDGEDLRGGTCADLGFKGGALGCDPEICQYDTRACTTWPTGTACTLDEQCSGGLCPSGICTADCSTEGCGLDEVCADASLLIAGKRCYQTCASTDDCHPNFVCRDAGAIGISICWFAP